MTLGKCKKGEKHLFQIVSPEFFDQENLPVKEYYQPKIDSILGGYDDWFYERTDVFIHLECINCQKDSNVYINAGVLDKTFKAGIMKYSEEAVYSLSPI